MPTAAITTTTVLHIAVAATTLHSNSFVRVLQAIALRLYTAAKMESIMDNLSAMALGTKSSQVVSRYKTVDLAIKSLVI